MLVHGQISPPTLVGYSVLSILIFEDREVYLYGPQPLGVISNISNAGIPLIYLTWTTLTKLLTMSSYHSQTHGPGKVMVTEAVEGFDLSNIYCSLGPLRDSVAMVDRQNQHPQGHPLWGNLLDGQIWSVVGSSRFTYECPSSLTFMWWSVPAWQLLIDLLELSWG